jgi:DNA polymerase elongation subunit (family B)
MNWIELPAGQYTLRENKPTSRCQIEVEVEWDKFISHSSEGQWSKMAPLRILSFDIECAGRKGTFPDAKLDPVIQIANMVTRQGEWTLLFATNYLMEEKRRIKAFYSKCLHPEHLREYRWFPSDQLQTGGEDAPSLE